MAIFMLLHTIYWLNFIQYKFVDACQTSFVFQQTHENLLSHCRGNSPDTFGLKVKGEQSDRKLLSHYWTELLQKKCSGNYKMARNKNCKNSIKADNSIQKE